MPNVSTEHIARGLPEGEHMLHCLLLPDSGSDGWHRVQIDFRHDVGFLHLNFPVTFRL